MISTREMCTVQKQQQKQQQKGGKKDKKKQQKQRPTMTTSENKIKQKQFCLLRAT